MRSWGRSVQLNPGQSSFAILSMSEIHLQAFGGKAVMKDYNRSGPDHPTATRSSAPYLLRTQKIKWKHADHRPALIELT